jgi:ribosomal protein L37AE/L43A
MGRPDKAFLNDQRKKGYCYICKRYKELIKLVLNGKTIWVCSDCKKLILRGFKLRDRKKQYGVKQQDELDDETIKEIIRVRKLFLKKMGKSRDWIDDRLKYEEFLVRAGRSEVLIPRDRCSICSSDKGVRVLIPDFIERFAPERKFFFGLPLCRACKKNVTDVTNSLIRVCK